MAAQSKGSRQAAFSFLEAGATAPLPGLAASAANRIPRWLLILIALLYIVHGLFHRDPWRGDDMLGLALARTSAEALLRGDFSVLLLPQLADLAWNQQGPLWTAVLAIFMLPIYAWSTLQQTPLPLHLLDDVARIPLGIALALGLAAIWKATDRFARRREAQPVDPLGLGPRSSEFGKTLGDCALLLTIAALGVVYPWHQLGTATVSLLLQGLLLWALATAPETPRRAAHQTALIITASLLTQGIGLALMQVIAILLVFAWIKPYRLAARDFLPRWLVILSGLILFWILASLSLHSDQRLAAWWLRGLSDWSLTQWFAGNKSVLRDVGLWFNASLWQWWPLWPIAAFGLWKIRHTDLSKAPHWAVPIVFTLIAVIAGLAGPSDWRVHQLLPLASIALIAAFSLLSLPCPIINLVDWLAVVLFTAVGIFIWLYWIALNFGIPKTLAERIPLLAPGVTGNATIYEILIGLLTTLAWVLLVAWRIRRGAPRLWRPVALSTGGITLLWVLLTTLWLPAINRIQGQQALAQSLESGWQRAVERRLGPQAGLMAAAQLQQAPIHQPAITACVRLSEQLTALDAMAVAITRLPISNQPHCLWRLGLLGPDTQRDTDTPATARWTIVWQSSGEDRRGRQRYVLLEKTP